MKEHMDSTTDGPLAILGGGVAGLAAGYFAGRRGLPFRIFEKQPVVGGNCITHRLGEFAFDSGAHRFHDKDAGATREIQGLLGGELRRIEIPSKIYDGGRFLTFPLAPLELVRHLRPTEVARAALEVGRARLRPRSRDRAAASFADFALDSYGRLVAERYLLNYSAKLWGVPCERLSPVVAGKRLKGLNLRTFLRDALPGGGDRGGHMEGTFFYPRGGIDLIARRLAEECGSDRITLGAEIVGLERQDDRITRIRTSDGESHPVSEVISTLPLGRLLGALDPAPPPDVLRAAERLRFRHVRLVFLALDRPSVMTAATIYFPSSRFPFTRLYEPRNRDPRMSPAGRTSVVAELPYQRGDAIGRLDEEELVALVRERLVGVGLVRRDEILDTAVRDLPFAYPVLELGYEEPVAVARDYLAGIGNLHLTGRNARFQYSWIHDMIRDGEQVVAELAAG